MNLQPAHTQKTKFEFQVHKSASPQVINVFLPPFLFPRHFFNIHYWANTAFNNGGTNDNTVTSPFL